MRVRWNQIGWWRALKELSREASRWKDQWVLVQYTALAWSLHGFPVRLLFVLWLLQIRRARLAIVFHDSEPHSGRRFVDCVRRMCQRWVIRYAYRLADKSILTVPVERVSWLPRDHSKATFIPVGANIPATSSCRCGSKGRRSKTIAVFGVTGDGSIGNELSDIAFVARAAAEHLPEIRLTMLGRGSMESESRMRRVLEGSAVEYRALGVLSAEAVSEVLADADVSLFVRGPISTQRGSAIASIACGLPLVAYSYPQLPAAFAETGVVGVPCGDREALAEETIKILTDRRLWLDLHRRSQIHFDKYFSWESIGARFVELLEHA